MWSRAKLFQVTQQPSPKCEQAQPRLEHTPTQFIAGRRCVNNKCSLLFSFGYYMELL